MATMCATFLTLRKFMFPYRFYSYVSYICHSTKKCIYAMEIAVLFAARCIYVMEIAVLFPARCNYVMEIAVLFPARCDLGVI
jgi:hypothetical protein